MLLCHMYIHVVMQDAGTWMIHEPGQGTEHCTVITGFYSRKNKSLAKRPPPLPFVWPPPTTLSNTGWRTITPNKGLRVL